MAGTPNLNLPVPAESDPADVPVDIGKLANAIDALAPLMFSLVGEIKMSGAQAAPTGWLLCDGSAVSRSTFSALYSAIGTSFGGGDGSTTFNLPDLRGRAPVGAGGGSGLSSRTLGARGGEESHALSIGEMPSHNHPLTGGANYLIGGMAGNMWSVFGTSTNVGQTQAGTQGGNGAHNNMQPYGVVNFFIKT